MRPTNSGKVTVTGKRVNRDEEYGSELPCEYLFYGEKFSREWLKKKLAKEGFDCEQLCCTLCKTFIDSLLTAKCIDLSLLMDYSISRT